MAKLNTITSLLVAATLSISATAVMAKSSPIKTQMEAYTISIDKEGKEVASKSLEATPRQTIEYRVTYENVSKSLLSGLKIKAPIPASTTYKQDSNKTEIVSTFMVSIDGGKTFESEPVKRMVKGADGKMIEKVIPASKYTHVSWAPKAGIKASEKQLYTYRVAVK
jgi:uncharacterized repeat protein (TIGR01451 family)